MNRTEKTRATLGLLYCAGECVPYSLLYSMSADVSRRQTVQTANSKENNIELSACSNTEVFVDESRNL